MIEIPRYLIQKWRNVWKKIFRGRTNAPAWFHLEGDGDSLAVWSISEHWGLRHMCRGHFAYESIALASSFLHGVTGKGAEMVRFTPTSTTTCSVGWQDGGQWHEQEYPSLGKDGPRFPSMLNSPQSVSPQLLSSLHEAMATASSWEAGRFPLQFVQLRATGDIIGTDGRALLWVTGFSFPWSGDLLLPRVKFLNDAEWRRKPLSLGRSEDFILINAGDWTLALRDVSSCGRFPDADKVLPPDSSIVARFEVADSDAVRALEALPRFALDKDSPAVLFDLSDVLRIRADVENGSCDEVTLTEGSVSGVPRVVRTNPCFFLRALKLGFRRFDIGDNVPIRSRDGDRLYLWMPLEPRVGS